MIVRPATPADVPTIAAIIAAHAQRGEMLARPADQIREGLGDFVVCEYEGAVVACSSLMRYSPALAEIRSLAVADGVQRNGWGSAMVQALRERAREEGITTLFALTRAAPFFERLGFARCERESFPEKIWRDCRLCPARERCDEEAVAVTLEANGAHGAGPGR
jgi:N-acetylglutamate synthase-like GNAT family acetyltransferase